MKISAFILLLGWVSMLKVYADGIIRGRITDENGEPMIGAAIVLHVTPPAGSIADFEGKYMLKVPLSTGQKISISFIGYQTIEDTILLSNNDILIRDYMLLPETKLLDDVVVTAKIRKSNESYMQLIKNKSAVSLDYISSETIKRTGDSHVTDAIKRVTGVSTVGGYITVRGLNDRYIKTSINGLRIPTLDPLTNNIRLDMFPTALVDNIVITKTASPDLPGDWAGSYVSIETKDYPDKLTVSFTSTFGYNAQSTGKEMYGSIRSETDWLGYDNGFRDLYRAGYNGSYPKPLSTPYYQFTALGLGDTIKNMGFTPETLGNDSRQNLDNSYRICLVKLGLLSPGLINNYDEVVKAANDYSRLYGDTVTQLLWKPVTEFGQQLPQNWGTVKRKIPLNFSQELNIGNQFNVFNRPMGFNLGFRYGNSIRYDADALSNNCQGAEPPSDNKDNYTQATSVYGYAAQANEWSALLNLAYSFSPHHSISLMFMPNMNGVNYIREGFNYVLGSHSTTENDTTYNISQYYEERKQLVYQFHSKHFIPGLKLKLDFHVSYTNGESGIPDSKKVTFYPMGDQYQYKAADYEYKKSTYLNEDVWDAFMSAELPIGRQPGLVRKLKFGGAFQQNTRESEIYVFYLSDYLYGDRNLSDPSKANELFNKESFAYNDSGFYYYNYEPSNVNFGYGQSNIAAGYVMADYAITPALRLSGGLRLEYTDILTDLRAFKDLPADDPARSAPSYIGGVSLPIASPGILKHYNYLPSLNVIYRILSNDKINLNTRLNYSKTIARPSIRELTMIYQEDFILQKNILGNQNLKIVEIDNYDLRFESFFANNDNISLSFFYKVFTNHIEMVEAPFLTWRNNDLSIAYGIEVEGLKKLSKNFDIRGNITLIESYTGEKSIPMYGQSPYIVNAILGYTADRYGITAALSYNVQGKKLVVLNWGSYEIESSHIYEMPRHILDFKFTKTLGDHFGFSFRIRNMLNAPYVNAYLYEMAGQIDYQNFTLGTEYLLGIYFNL